MKTRRQSDLIKPLVVVIILLILTRPFTVAADIDNFDPQYLKASAKDMQWWRDAKFGMFVCWGPASLTDKEVSWSRKGNRKGDFDGTGVVPADEYDNLYKKWKPDKFDAHQWVQLAKDAEAKYIIFLVKHHDGFCLYDSKLTDYKSTSKESALSKDYLKDIADACHKLGIKLFVYYSPPDWHHPDYRTKTHNRYIEYMHGQIREILTNYGRVNGLWFDGGRGDEYAKRWGAKKLFKMVRSLQPHIIINDRCGLPGDYHTPEQQVGQYCIDRAWESCITMGGLQWSWKPNSDVKSLAECIHMLIRCVANGGNLALNTGPMPDGRIEPRQAKRFREMGKWLKKHGESVYETMPGPYRMDVWGASTREGKNVYLHPAKIIQSKDTIEISAPAEHCNNVDTVVKLELDKPFATKKFIRVPSGSIAVGQKAAAPNIYQNSPTCGADKAFDDNESTNWITNWGCKSAWLQVDFDKPATFDRLVIYESGYDIQEYEIHYKNEGDWQKFAQGKQLREKWFKFDPITARSVKLVITKAARRPGIWEFQIYPVRKR
ncbi:MAG: alpha-L-fucosidase [Planctomycetota bacterium]|jgi:alpha-L-fucosidase